MELVMRALAVLAIAGSVCVQCVSAADCDLAASPDIVLSTDCTIPAGAYNISSFTIVGGVSVGVTYTGGKGVALWVDGAILINEGLSGWWERAMSYERGAGLFGVFIALFCSTAFYS
jgi:hypothetical protein